MNRKAFFIDLDGTTLRDDKTIPEENIEAIRSAADHGHYVAIATGRAIASAYPVVEKLGMFRQGCYLISYNGARIYELEHRRILRDLELPDACASYLFREARSRGFYIQAYSDTHIRAPYRCHELEYYAEMTAMNYRIEEDLFELEQYHTPKVLLVSTTGHEALRQFQETHMEWEKGRCISFFSCPEYLEYCPALGTKAEGIRFLEQYLNIGHSNTIAIGDERNDLSMIQYAGTGAVMHNADDYVKGFADYITTRDNNHGGMAEVLYHFMEKEV